MKRQLLASRLFVAIFAVTLPSGAEAVAKPIVVAKGSSIGYSDMYRTVLKVVLAKTSPSTASKSFQWFRGTVAIAGAKGSTYSIQTLDRGKLLWAKVTLKKSGYATKVVATTKLKVEAQNSSPYKLLWSDEFTGGAGSDVGDKWVAQEGDGRNYGAGAGWGNSELQYYLRSQATLDGKGYLSIKAQNDGAANYDCYYGDCLWLSSKLVTKDVVGFRYGRIEARIKGAAGEGTWPAFWTLGADIDSVPWPNCGEIDIVELKGSNPAYVWGTGHGPLSGGMGRGGSTILLDSTTSGYHRYAIDWTLTKIRFYVDDELYYTYVKSDSDWAFSREMYLILNLAMGGHWGGGVDLDLTESTMSVDYVRMYSISGLGEVITH